MVRGSFRDSVGCIGGHIHIKLLVLNVFCAALYKQSAPGLPSSAPALPLVLQLFLPSELKSSLVSSFSGPSLWQEACLCLEVFGPLVGFHDSL